MLPKHIVFYSKAPDHYLSPKTNFETSYFPVALSFSSGSSPRSFFSPSWKVPDDSCQHISLKFTHFTSFPPIIPLQSPVFPMCPFYYSNLWGNEHSDLYKPSLATILTIPYQIIIVCIIHLCLFI
jgi:hypothetical protein